MREIPALLKSRCRLMGICFCLALLCSCVTAPDRLADDSIRPTLPADAPINKGAGRGDYLFVTLRLESGEELLMLVDTGCERTMFDKSLEPKLGKRRGTRSLWYGYLGPRRVGLYRAPKLYLGNTPLLTGDLVATDDLRWMTPGRPTAGVLGTDCLRHYCIQLDFASGRMRFLDPDHVKAEDLGKAFLLRRFLGQVITRADLFGRRAYFALDSADPGDGVLKSKLFRRELRQQNAVLTNRVAWFAKGGTRWRNLYEPDVK